MASVVEQQRGPIDAATPRGGDTLKATRVKLARDARELSQISSRLVAYNLGYMVLAWAVAIGAIGVFWWHPAWYTFVLAYFVVSSRQQALLNCEHECVHNKFLPTRRWNELVGRYLCASPVGSPFGAARDRHLAHHQLLGTPEDPDRELHSGEPPKNTPLGVARYFLSGLLGGYAGMVLMGPPPKVPGATYSRRRDLVALVLVQGLIAAGLTIAFGWWVYPALWLAPLATLTALTHLVRSFVEHAITADETDDHSNRLITIHSNPLERELVAPYGMNYHAEHHILPSVPAPRLRRLQRRLADRDGMPPMLRRSSYSAAIRHYVRSLRG
jgi:fatty acid desaturase